jgi:hypothetical protein
MKKTTQERIRQQNHNLDYVCEASTVSTVNERVPKRDEYITISERPNSFLWSVFILQPTGHAQTVAGERA